MLPDIEGQQRLQTLRKRVASVGFLGDEEGAVGGGGEPDPAGAEEGGAFGDEVGLEGGEGAPLLLDLRQEIRFLDCGFASARNDRKRTPTRAELREIQVMVQDLAGVVEDGLRFLDFARNDNDLFEGFILELGAGDEAVEVVDIALEVLAVVEADGIGADDRCQGIGGVREVD